jgi:hypothetical protein
MFFLGILFFEELKMGIKCTISYVWINRNPWEENEKKGGRESMEAI